MYSVVGPQNCFTGAFARKVMFSRAYGMHATAVDERLNISYITSGLALRSPGVSKMWYRNTVASK